MSGICYYIIDLETTGLRSGWQEVFEISIIRASDKMQLTRRIKCEYGERASWDALQITNTTLADLEKGQSKEQTVKEANEFFNQDGLGCAHRCIIGHNIWAFDRKFLHSLWASVDQVFPAHLFLDTITLTKKFIEADIIDEDKLIKTATGKTSTKLHAACDMTGVKKVAGQHNARSDSRNTYLLWQKLVNEHKIDYLPHIKTSIHTLKKDDLEDIDLLDLNDI